MKKYGLWIDGRERLSQVGEWQAVYNPYNREVIAEVTIASKEDIHDAIHIAREAFEDIIPRIPTYERANILKRCGELLLNRLDYFSEIIILEAGKPLRASRNEVLRVAEFLEEIGASAKRIKGEVLPLDASRGGDNRFGYTVRVPFGVIAAFGPFNAPLNSVVQRVASAIATGNSVVLKPHSETPIASLELAKLMKEAGLPDGILNVITGPDHLLNDQLVSDKRIGMVTFVGKAEAGKRVHAQAGLKKTVYELGSNAPNIVFADADLVNAVQALSLGSFANAGQACMAVQRIYVQKEIYNNFVEDLISSAKQLQIGNPVDEGTVVGPMISPRELERVIAWIEEARAAGAQVVLGGQREGNILLPTIITNVNNTMKIHTEDLFAPVCTITPFETKEEAVQLANDSRFGLQAGVFTKDIGNAFYTAKRLDIGAIWINEASRYRQDNYPFGGFKQSGIGREGLEYITAEMTQTKFIGYKLTE